MTNSNEDVERLMAWASTIDLSSLRNEDDVETKIILPFFKLLGYPETHRRGKFPIDDYQSRRAGRKSEADQVYFSTADQDEQNADTALLLIEAKKTLVHSLEGAIGQAKYYGNILKSPFLVITNGRQIIVLKRHQHHNEEVIAEIAIDKLRDQATANTIYDQLQFETVKKLKEQLVDPLKHAQYVELMQILDRHPDIQEHLAKGDFEPSSVRDGRLLRVVKPRVAITCELPIAFAEGNCTIECNYLGQLLVDLPKERKQATVPV
jgi:Type I restriction enzyme R protein N terminus (HSDR_N)